MSKDPIFVEGNNPGPQFGNPFKTGFVKKAASSSKTLTNLVTLINRQLICLNHYYVS